MSKPKMRASLQDGKDYNKNEIIRAALSRFNTAMDHSFYLEATALIESLISDRLESRLSELTKTSVNFDTIGNLLTNLRKEEVDSVLIEIMNKQINNWCGDRNITIHQAAKIEFGKNKNWIEFLKLAEKTAKVGRKIFDTYNSQLQKTRRTKK